MPAKEKKLLTPTDLEVGQKVKIDEGNADGSIPGRDDYYGTVAGPSDKEGCVILNVTEGNKSFHASRLTKV